MPIKITIEDPDKYRRMGKTMDDWTKVASDVSGVTIVNDENVISTEDSQNLITESGTILTIE